jgi:hypothetical protein
MNFFSLRVIYKWSLPKLNESIGALPTSAFPKTWTKEEKININKIK